MKQHTRGIVALAILLSGLALSPFVVYSFQSFQWQRFAGLYLYGPSPTPTATLRPTATPTRTSPPPRPATVTPTATATATVTPTATPAPPGAVEATIEPATGGSLVYTNPSGVQTIIEVPAGAVDEAITLLFIPVDQPEDNPDFIFAGHAFDLDAYNAQGLLPGLAFNVPVIITLNYSDADVAGLNESELILEYWDGTAWVDAACGEYQRNLAENWLRVPICHLSRFALFGDDDFFLYMPYTQR